LVTSTIVIVDNELGPQNLGRGTRPFHYDLIFATTGAEALMQAAKCSVYTALDKYIKVSAFIR